MQVCNTNSTNLVVSNVAGNVVFNSHFVGLSTEMFSALGDYSLEIYNGGMTFVGA